MMFGLGGYVLYEGFHKLHDPHVLENVPMGLGMCFFALCLESYSVNVAYGVIRHACKKQNVSLLDYLRHGSDSSSVHVFMEDCAGVFCTIVAFTSVIGSGVYMIPLCDPVGSIIIGTTICATGVFLFNRNMKLLVGKSLPDP
eukprot:UN30658